MYLAGDLGGTKTALALYRDGDPSGAPVRTATVASGDHAGLEEIIAVFLAEGHEALQAACFAVAGPVEGDKARITNLPWTIDGAELGQRFKIGRVAILNDLQAVATVVPHLAPHHLQTLNPGVTDPTGTIAVIAPGTGLGISFLVSVDGRYHAFPTEGGHVAFAPRSAEETDLLRVLEGRFGHVSVERVCSGSGIPNLYDYLRDANAYPEPDWLKAELDQVRDRTPVIVNAALAKRAAICTATLDMFVRILAGVIGNVAVMLMARGGVYLGGGMPPRILSRLQQPDFISAVSDKGRFSELCATIPLHVILDSKAALHGAAWHARALMS